MAAKAKTTTAETADPIREAALTKRRLQKEIADVRALDATRGDISARGELTKAFNAAAAELDRLCDEVIGRQ